MNFARNIRIGGILAGLVLAAGGVTACGTGPQPAAGSIPNAVASAADVSPSPAAIDASALALAPVPTVIPTLAPTPKPKATPKPTPKPTPKSTKKPTHKPTSKPTTTKHSIAGEFCSNADHGRTEKDPVNGHLYKCSYYTKSDTWHWKRV